MKLENLRQWVLGAVAACAFLAHYDVHAQGTIDPIIMRTGSGVLTTRTVDYASLPGDSSRTDLEFSFGFATAEQSQPGAFLDSFTVSIEGPGGVIYLVTADSTGVLWAPTVPGSIPVLSESIFRQPTSFLIPDEGLSHKSAYQVTYGLPAAWWASPLVVTLDFFDNQDPLASLSYFDPSPAVPEPQALTLLIPGLLAFRLFRSRFVPAK